MNRTRDYLASFIAILLLFLMPRIIDNPAWGQRSCNLLQNFAGPCTVNFDSDVILVQPASANTFSFTVSGKDTGSGSFSLSQVGPTTVQVTGSGTVDGATGPLSCTVDVATQTIVSGQCGILTSVFAGATQAKAAVN